MPKRKSVSQPAHTEPVVRIVRPEELGFGRIFNQLSDAVVVMDAATGVIVLWNAAAEAVFGYSAQEAVGMLLEDLLPERYRERYQAGIARFLATGKSKHLGKRSPLELPGRTKDGDEVVVELTLSRIDDAEVPGTFVAALMRDVTERNRLETENRRSEALLRENAALLSAVIDNTSDLIYVKDLEGRIRLINQAGAAAIGQPIAAIIGRTDAELVGDDTARAFREHENRVIEVERPITVEEPVRLADGRVGTFLTTKHPLFDTAGKVTGIVGISHNITERKQAEELLKCRAKQQLAVSQLGQRALSGLALEELFGEAARLVASTLEVKFVEILELLAGSDELQLRAGTGWKAGLVGQATVPAGMSSQAGYTLLSREPVIVSDLSAETRFRGSALLTDHRIVSGVSVVIGGREVPFGVLGAYCEEPTVFTQDDVSFMQGIANVLALAIARKEVEGALKSSEMKWRSLVENAPQVITILDVEGRMQFINRAPEGIKPETLVGRSIFEFLSKEDQHRIRPLFQRVLQTGEPESYETQATRPNGTPGWYQSAVGLICEPGELPRFIMVAADISTRVFAEEAARASEIRLRALMDHAQEIIIEVDRDYRIQFVNRTLPNFDPTQVIGRTIFEYLAPEEHARIKAIYDRVFSTGKPGRFEVRGKGADGQWTWYQSSIGAIKVDDRVDSVVVLSRDVAEEKKALEALRASEHQLAKAQAIAHMGNWEWDLATDRLSWSEELHRIMGLPKGRQNSTLEARMKTVHPGDRAMLREAFVAATHQGKAFTLEYRILHPDGTIRYVLTRGEPERDKEGRIVRVVGITQDITELREAFQALEQRTAELRQARELDHLKSSFVNSVSHELRTPLTSIVGYAEFLQDELGGPVSPEQREYIEEILKGGRRLERLIDDLLDFARIDAGTFKLRLEEVDLGAKAREIVASMQPQALSSQLTLELFVPEKPLMARMDPQRIGQVLTNLIMNAIKFTPAGGHVKVAVTEYNGNLRCEVTDTGPGIAAEDQPKLFQRFSQLKNSRRKGGAGLGLSISKALVEAHGGQIGVISEPNRGATFWFLIPRNGPPAESEARA